MCGIAGIITLNPNNVSIAKLKLMTDAIAHRGPDGEGQWIDETAKVGLAHRRLSIIDLASTADQPMHYLDRYTIVFNGEIYNYIELKQQLLHKGYTFRTQSDTEVLLALFDLKKEACLHDLEGMFAFAIWDKQEQSLFCARDRFGEKPFYYHHNAHSFYFASEMKALWAVGVPKQPNPTQVFLYLGYGAQNNAEQPTQTFYANIQQLQHAHCFTLRNNVITNHRQYWDIDLKNRNQSITLSEATEKFHELFSTSIQHRLRSDVAVGSSLSGGLDSSSIVTLIDKLKPESQIQKTFSARFTNFNKDEGEYIAAVVAANNVQSHEVFLTPELLNAQLNQVYHHQEQPFGSTSIIAQWEVMKLAKQHNITVLLDGQGADELLSGYNHYFYNYYSSLMRTNKQALAQQQAHYLALNNKAFDCGNNFKLHTYFPQLRSNLRIIKNKFTTPNYFKQFNAEYLNEYKNTPFNTGFITDLNQALYHSTMKGGLQNLLHYADRNSMAHSREVRLPFLNYKLVEFIFSLPDEFKLHNGWTKYILRNSMNAQLPNAICWRKDKVGFEPPNYKYIAKDIAEHSKEILLKHNLLNKNNSATNLDWEYYQVSKLYL
jgi:asparagine synthase (glutamine-hydrolysing)